MPHLIDGLEYHWPREYVIACNAAFNDLLQENMQQAGGVLNEAVLFYPNFAPARMLRAVANFLNGATNAAKQDLSWCEWADDKDLPEWRHRFLRNLVTPIVQETTTQTVLLRLLKLCQELGTLYPNNYLWVAQLHSLRGNIWTELKNYPEACRAYKLANRYSLKAGGPEADEFLGTLALRQLPAVVMSGEGYGITWALTRQAWKHGKKHSYKWYALKLLLIAKPRWLFKRAHGTIWENVSQI